MIAELGDLFQTFDDAPDTNSGATKKAAFAFLKGTGSFQHGGQNSAEVNLLIYEEGYPVVSLVRQAGTYTFKSSSTYKHVIVYNGFGNNLDNYNIKWCLNKSLNISNGRNPVTSYTYFHIEKDSSVQVLFTQGFYEKVGGYSTGNIYYPDWYKGRINGSSSTNCKSIRFSAGMSRWNTYYSWGVNASQNPNLKDIYCHWELGKVPNAAQNNNGTPTIPFSLPNCKLHIPDLGNPTDNAALVTEYRNKAWGALGGAGIFNDVETTEPQEQIK